MDETQFTEHRLFFPGRWTVQSFSQIQVTAELRSRCVCRSVGQPSVVVNKYSACEPDISGEIHDSRYPLRIFQLVTPRRLVEDIPFAADRIDSKHSKAIGIFIASRIDRCRCF